MDATESIEKLIRDLEAEQARTAQLLGDLRSALARARNGTPPTQPRKAVAGVFQRKYDQNARELIIPVLRDNRKALHVGQIQDALKARGYEFIKATISLNLKDLEKEEKVRRVKAPKGSGFSHAWVLEKEHPPSEET